MLLHCWNPLCGISSVFFIHLLQRDKLLAAPVTIMYTLESDRRSRKDGENTRWEQPHCVLSMCGCTCLTNILRYEQSGVCNFCFGLCVHMHSSRWRWAHAPICVCIVNVSCMCVWHRVEENRTGFISTCQQWVFKDMRPLDWGGFLRSCIFYLNSAGEIKKYLWRNQKRVTLRQLTVQHLTVETAKKRQKRGWEYKCEDGGTRRRSVFASGGGRRLMLACNLEVICGRM